MSAVPQSKIENRPSTLLRAGQSTIGWLSVDQAAAVLHKTPRHVRRMCANGELEAVRLPATCPRSGDWLIDPACRPALRIAAGLPGGPALAGDELAGLTQSKRAAVLYRHRVLQEVESLLADKGPSEKTDTLKHYVDFHNATGDDPGAPGLSVSTLYNWRRRFKTHGIAGLVDARKYTRASTISPDAWRLFCGMYLRQAEPKIPRLWETVAAIARKKNWTWPSLRTIQWRVQTKLDPKIIAAGRTPKKFRDRCTPDVVRDWSLVFAMQCWVADHRNLDVLWPRYELKHKAWFWRRPWITAFLDARTWYVPSWTLCFEAANGDRVMAAFSRGVLAHGQPEHVYLDNGKDFRMKRFSGGRKNKIVEDIYVAPLLETLGIKSSFAIPFNAKAKVIEPWFKLMAECFDRTWPTYCGRSPQHRPEQLKAYRDKAGEYAASVMDADQFREITCGGLAQEAVDSLCLQPLASAFETWLNADYHLRTSPAAAAGGLSAVRAFSELRAPDFIARRPSESDLALLCQPSVAVSVAKNGVWVRAFGSFYWSDDLEPLRAASGRDGTRKIIYRLNPDDPSKICVFDRRDKFLCWATPYVGTGVHPLVSIADDPAESDRLGAVMEMSRAYSKRSREEISGLKRYANNVLLARSAEAAGELDKLDDFVPTKNTPLALKFGGEITRASRSAPAARSPSPAPSAAELLATGTDDISAECPGAPGRSAISPLDYLTDDGASKQGRAAPRRGRARKFFAQPPDPA
jgi:hypothetical protein